MIYKPFIVIETIVQNDYINRHCLSVGLLVCKICSNFPGLFFTTHDFKEISGNIYSLTAEVISRLRVDLGRF